MRQFLLTQQADDDGEPCTSLLQAYLCLRKHAKGKSLFSSTGRGEKAILQLYGLMRQECLDIIFDVSEALRGVCEADVVHHDHRWPC